MPALVDVAPDWYDPDKSLEWYKTNWTICLPLIVAYLIVVYGLQKMMTNRKPFNVKIPLVIWNSLLAVFSVFGAIQSIYDGYVSLKTLGFTYGICDNAFIREKSIAFWSWLFMWSKIVEFGDTVFLVLRGKPVMFLQVYHHATVGFCVFLTHSMGTAVSRWSIIMNFTIHSFMYTYFAIVCMGYRVPRFFTMILTSAQLSQMLIAIGINLYHINRLINGFPCASSVKLASFSIFVYSTYAFLFAQLFINKYFFKSKLKSK